MFSGSPSVRPGITQVSKQQTPYVRTPITRFQTLSLECMVVMTSNLPWLCILATFTTRFGSCSVDFHNLGTIFVKWNTIILRFSSIILRTHPTILRTDLILVTSSWFSLLWHNFSCKGCVYGNQYLEKSRKYLESCWKECSQSWHDDASGWKHYVFQLKKKNSVSRESGSTSDALCRVQSSWQ